MAALLLPMEVITAEILPRLPGKSLLRFKCVCKSLQTLISSPEFIDAHLRHSLSSDTNRHLLLVDKSDRRLFSFDLDTPNSAAIRLPLLHRFDDYTSFALGSCNELFCFVVIDIDMFSYYTLFNPSTGFYKDIAFDISELPIRYIYLNFGLGFDCENNDYKLVIIVDYFGTKQYELGDEAAKRQVIVCSSRTGCRTLTGILLPEDSVVLHHMAVTKNNSFLNCVFWSSSKNKHRCGCFDVCGEQWVEDVPLPDYNGGDIEKLHDYMFVLVDYESPALVG